MKLEELRLNEAEALLQRAGLALPVREGLSDAGYLQMLIDAVCELCARDPLTGLLNRRAFVAVLEQEVDRVARMGESSLLVAVDIDHFKRINDSYGHAAGDDVLRAVAGALTASVRPMDTVARLGGEEFAVVFPNCPPSYGEVVAERIRVAVEALPIEYSDQQMLGVTVSCGGAYAPAWVRTSVETWLERADRQMYRAKQQGRNCVVMEPMTTSDVSAEEKGLLFAWASADTLMIDPVAPQ